MHWSNLDAYFYMAAKGDKESLELLYSAFRKRADNFIRISMSKIVNLYKNPEEFTDFIDHLFFRAIKEYDHDRGSFLNYVDYVFKMRLCTKVQTEAIIYADTYTDIQNDIVEEMTIEQMPDPSQHTMQHDIACHNFKSYISSIKRYYNKDQRMQHKILMLQFAGFSNSEICRELKITQGILRGHLERIKKDQHIVNFKLEMK